MTDISPVLAFTEYSLIFMAHHVVAEGIDNTPLKSPGNTPEDTPEEALESANMAQDLVQQVDPFASLRNTISLCFGLTNLPEYHGSPSEDLDKFLSEFGRATTAFTHEQKCLALKKSLVGDAGRFLKDYLKEYVSLGKWKEAKAELRKRFARTEPSLYYRIELNKMKFDGKESSLLGYVDKYASIYKKVHSDTKDAELILELSLNLGKAIILKLNQISSDWKQITEFGKFRDLIWRLEKDIMCLEEDLTSQMTNDLSSTVNKLVTTALEEPIKGMKEVLAQLAKQTQETQKVEAAAVKHTEYPNNKYKQNYSKRKERWDNGNEAKKRDDGEETAPHAKTGSELMKAYEEEYGKVPGLCYFCNGRHWRRHCPIGQEDLKGSGNRK